MLKKLQSDVHNVFIYIKALKDLLNHLVCEQKTFLLI